MVSLYPKCPVHTGPVHTGPVANAARHLGKGERTTEREAFSRACLVSSSLAATDLVMFELMVS